MNLQLYDNYDDTCEKLIEYVYQQGWIDVSRKQKLFIDLTELYRKSVLLYQHQKSTCVRTDIYTMIQKTLVYLVKKGIRTYEDFQKYSLTDIFYQGQKNARNEVRKIQAIYQQMIQNPLPFKNEVYNDLLDNQIPNYIKHVKGYLGIFYLSNANEEFDYPLIDGNFWLNGKLRPKNSEFVFSYLQRFYCEYKFCLYFKADIPELLHSYELQKNISPEILSFNLFEILYLQVIAKIILNSDSFILQENDLIQLKHKFSEDLDACMNTVMMTLSDQLDKGTIQYLKKINKFILEVISHFLNEPKFDLFLTEKKEKPKYIISSERCSEQEFQKHLSNLYDMNSCSDKIAYLNTIPIHVYDVIDLLENNIFMQDEFIDYFQSLDLSSFIIFLNAAYPHMNVFGSISNLEELDGEGYSFEYPLQKYLQSFPDEKKKLLIQHLQNIDVQIDR